MLVLPPDILRYATMNTRYKVGRGWFIPLFFLSKFPLTSFAEHFD